MTLPSEPIWRFSSLRLRDPTGRNPIFGNFRNEGYSDCQAFVREFLQNTLDNRRKIPGGGLAKACVRFRLLSMEGGLDPILLKWAFGSLEQHLEAAGLPSNLRDYDNARVLVIEEYETTGFGGVYNHSRAKGDFASFFHGEADDTKTGGKNGRAGQGKATYNMISDAGAFLTLTVRADDNKRLLMGKAAVPRTHEVDGRSFGYRGFWCDWIVADDDEQPIPVQDASIQERVAEGFGLNRGPSEYGSSFVIPFPKPEVTAELIVQVVLEEYFYSIIKGRLEVEVEGLKINRETVFGLVEERLSGNTTGHQPPSTAFLNFIKSATEMDDSTKVLAGAVWEGAQEMAPEMFGDEAMSAMKATLAAGGIVWARLPVHVRRLGSAKVQSHIDVFVRHSEEIERTEEAFIRRDLYIAKEKHLKGAVGQVHALVLADDEAISDFLAYAEVASHLTWNASEAKLVERYTPSSTLRAVRTSARRLLELLVEGDEEISTDLLIDLLSIPSGNAPGKEAGGKGKRKVRPPVVNPPVPTPRYHRITDGSGVRVEAGEQPVPQEKFPVLGALEIAYENVSLGGNAFSNYHPFDFDLADPIAHKITSKGVSLKSRNENEIAFSINEADWFLEVQGFDPNKPIRARAKLEI